jgi:tetratricopeptide (TPR) repeat protein
MSRIGSIFLFVLFFLQIDIISAENRDSLQQLLYITNLPAEKINLLNLLAESYLKDDPLKAYNYAGQARSLSESTGNLQGKSEALFLMALCTYKQEDYLVANNLIQESLQGFKKTKDVNGMGKSNLELGKIYLRQYEYEKALEVLFNAVEIFTNLDNSSKLAETYNIIGINYYDQENYDKAFEFFQSALQLRIKLNDETGLSSLYNNIGEIHRFKGELEIALEYYKKAVRINTLINRLESLNINYDNIGNTLMLQGKYDSALYYLNKSLNISKRLKNEDMISLVYLSLGNLYAHFKKGNEALLYFDSGYQIAYRQGYLLNLKNAAYGLSEIYKNNEQFEKAYYYHQIYKTVGDSLFSLKNLEKITQHEMKLVFDREKKIKSLKLEKTIYKYFLITFSLLSILLIFILLYGRLRIKIKHVEIEKENLLLESQQLRKEIDFKNRELATNVMYLVKKNELINFISEKLLKAKSIFKAEQQPVVQQLILDLQSSVDIDIWKSFEERFLEVHKEFYQTLNQNFPLLSENDKKLCALLRLNMSTKDIAAITHQNPNSIEVARTRLRKKLNISNKEINLVSFLANI